MRSGSDSTRRLASRRARRKAQRSLFDPRRPGWDDVPPSVQAEVIERLGELILGVYRGRPGEKEDRSDARED